ncbi:MAG: divalent-cation tolerance protein CutA [Acidobacteriota bacterium]|nr:divalent-cation tolerance protein CutA [Acidobacteriota bacterium]
MTDKCVTLVTAGSMQEAKRIATRLVESRLAACVNIVGRVLSIYRWKGKVTDGKEVLLLIKSKRNSFAEVVKIVRANHSYTTPEIISIPVIDGSQDYLAWIDASTKAAGRRAVGRKSRGKDVRNKRRSASRGPNG